MSATVVRTRLPRITPCKAIFFISPATVQRPDDRECIKALERKVRELRQANEILSKASAYLAQSELDRRWKL